MGDRLECVCGGFRFKTDYEHINGKRKAVLACQDCGTSFQYTSEWRLHTRRESPGGDPTYIVLPERYWEGEHVGGD